MTRGPRPDSSRASSFSAVSLELPDWVEGVVRRGERIPDRTDRMRLAIRLAAENAARGTGGPFGAAVIECDSGRVVSAGVNVVVPSACSLAHAEALAIALAWMPMEEKKPNRTSDCPRFFGCAGRSVVVFWAYQ